MLEICIFKLRIYFIAIHVAQKIYARSDQGCPRYLFLITKVRSFNGKCPIREKYQNY